LGQKSSQARKELQSHNGAGKTWDKIYNEFLVAFPLQMLITAVEPTINATLAYVAYDRPLVQGNFLREPHYNLHQLADQEAHRGQGQSELPSTNSIS
jgi:hypothetical protein